jgi:hypothetical protein
MRKNRVKISQTKPKKSGSDQRTEAKTLTVPKEQLNNSDSLSLLEIPSEPSFKLPIRSHVPGEIIDEQEIKSSSSNILQEKSLQNQENLFSNSHSDFEITPRETIGEYSELDGSHPKDLIFQIKELQSEISSMNQRILVTEEEMKSKELEAQELKELLVKLRENQVMIIETAEKQQNCKSCRIF